MEKQPAYFEDMYKLIGLLMGGFMKIHGDPGSGELARIQLGALGILSVYDDLPVSELAKRLRISKPQATNLVRRLEELGLVKRTACAEDARISRLWLTAKGRKALDGNMERMKQGMEDKLSALSQDEKSELKRSMQSLVRILEKLEA